MPRNILKHPVALAVEGAMALALTSCSSAEESDLSQAATSGKSSPTIGATAISSPSSEYPYLAVPATIANTVNKHDPGRYDGTYAYKGPRPLGEDQVPVHDGVLQEGVPLSALCFLKDGPSTRNIEIAGQSPPEIAQQVGELIGSWYLVAHFPGANAAPNVDAGAANAGGWVYAPYLKVHGQVQHCDNMPS